MKKLTSLILVLIMCMTALLSINVSAASYPSLSSSKYCEFTAAKKMTVYVDSNVKTPGTSSPYKKYDAYIAKNDKCYIYKITSSYAQVNYPTSSGRKTGYIRTQDLLGGKINPTDSFTAKKTVNTYKYKNGEKSGYYEYGDTVYNLSGVNYDVIYTAKSGNRAYKLAYVGNKKEEPAPSGNYSQKVNAFLTDSRWKVGTKWGNSQGPKLSNYSSSGCCAYAADFVKYVFGASSPRNNRKFTNANEIKAGDILYVTPTHWMVVLGRSGNKLDIVHGNWTDGKVCRGNFTLNGNSIGKKTFSYGYHFQ